MDTIGIPLPCPLAGKTVHAAKLAAVMGVQPYGSRAEKDLPGHAASVLVRQDWRVRHS